MFNEISNNYEYVEIMIKYTNKINVKRFCINNLKYKEKCSKCNSKCNIINPYIMYPESDNIVNISFYCEKCNYNFDINYIFNLYIKLTKTNEYAT